MPKQRAVRRARVLAAMVGAVVTPMLVTGVAVTPAHADLPYVAWSTYLPGWTEAYVPTSENDCVSGRAACLKQTRKEFGRILEETARSCHHNAVFAMTYTRITQTYGWSRDLPGYYQDVPYMNHMDAVFAKYYTDAYYHYKDGNRADVPAAWLKAFDAARDRRMTATGDLSLIHI